MSDIRRLDPAEAASALGAEAGRNRGFLGLDPVTQNHALLVRELTRLEAQLFASGADLFGYRINPEQPRQAYLATTATAPEALARFLEFLRNYQRCTSYVSEVSAGSPSVAALTGCGFRPVGTLRDHRFAAGGYHDVTVYFTRGEAACPS
jgi:hypothetical protein